MEQENNNEERQQPKGLFPSFSSTSPYLTLGIQLALNVIILFVLGKLIDDYCKTTPWFMLGFILFGSVGSIIKFVRTVTKIAENEDAKRQQQRSKPQT